MQIDRPLRLGEIVAETVRLYGERIWATLTIGVVVVAALLGAIPGNDYVDVGLLSLAFTVAFASAARVAAGDRVGEVWAQVAFRAPLLLALTVVVSLPVVLTLITFFVFGLLPVAAWLGLTSFAIPAAMLDGGGLPGALRRTVALARTEYFHATGVSATFLALTVLLAVVLYGALVSFAENDARAAVLVTAFVLAPFFFLGLAVLYFEQSARALSSPRRT